MYGRNVSNRFVLIPRIASKSSTRRNRPLFCRASMILCAVTGPTPGNSSNSLIVAAFRSIGFVGGFFFPWANAIPDTKASKRRNEKKLCLDNLSIGARLRNGMRILESAFDVTFLALILSSSTR